MTDATRRQPTIRPLRKGNRGLGVLDEEAAAQGCFVILRPGKRRAIRILERILYPVVRMWERMRPGPNKTAGVVQKILVVEYSLLGDIILLLPFLQNLRAHYPSAQITLLVNPSVLTLLKHQELADELVSVRLPWVEHLSRWRKWNPLSPLWINLVRRLLSLRVRQFDLAFSVRGDVGGGAFLLTDAVVPDLDHPHISDRWLRFLEYLGKPVLERHPRLRLTPSEEEFAEQYLAERGIQYGDFVVGIHSKARVPTRRWQEENFRAIGERLINQFSAKILWFHDPQEGNKMDASVNGVVPVCLGLREFMAVLSHCKFLVCNDGGQMHIATALDVPVVAIFGSTEPAWYAPIGEQNRIVIRPGFWCRPCGERCVFDEPYCIRSISIEQVYTAAEEMARRLASQEAFLPQ